MHPVLGTMMPEICEAPHFSCQPRLHTQIVGMRSLHSPMTSLKTSIKTITYLSDIGCLEIQGASLDTCLQRHISGDFFCLNPGFQPQGIAIMKLHAPLPALQTISVHPGTVQ